MAKFTAQPDRQHPDASVHLNAEFGAGHGTERLLTICKHAGLDSELIILG